MSNGKNTLLPVILLVVGLIVGAGGGYLFVNNSFQPTIDGLKNQIETKDIELDSIQTGLTEIESELEETRGEIQALEEDIEEKNAELTTINENLSVSEEWLAETTSTKNELYELICTPDGCYKINLFGVSFDCPNDTNLELAGLTGGPADGSGGNLVITQVDKEYDLGVSWISTPHYDGMVEYVVNETRDALVDTYDVTVTGWGNTTINDYEGMYCTTMGEIDGYNYGIFCIFYSAFDNKMYIIQYNVVEEADLPNYMSFFDSIRVGEA